MNWESCGYLAIGDTEIVADQYDHCLMVIGPNQVKISTEHIKKMNFGDKQLMQFIYRGGVGYVNRSGKAVVMLPFDNGADTFEEGLARFLGPNGKVGFVNESLEIVIPAQFDFVFQMSHGKAEFCQGCKKTPVGNGDEHSYFVGGIHGYVDSTGHVLDTWKNK